MGELEEHFMSMDVEAKLDKRRNELAELKSICEDFGEKLGDMRRHLLSDLGKLRERRETQVQLEAQSMTGTLMDEFGNPVNLIKELTAVEEELQGILSQVVDLQASNDEIRQAREEAEAEFAAFQTPTFQEGIFGMLRVNGETKRKIIGLIKQLKDVSKRIKETKAGYQAVRNRLAKQQIPRRLYKAVAGD
jgi:hypothetical protein